jgi:hypothetical protein
VIDFFSEKKAEATELGFDEATVSVLNSYCNELFQLGYDLIQPRVTSSPEMVGISCRGGEFTLSISVSRLPLAPSASSKVMLSAYKNRGDEQWSYSTPVGPGLLHFSMLIASFPGIRR